MSDDKAWRLHQWSKSPVSHTRTHVTTTFANPFLICDRCRQPVTGFHDPQRCGCDEPDAYGLVPCGDNAGATSVCPSWSPVDGCCCLAHLGYVPHGPSPAVLPGWDEVHEIPTDRLSEFVPRPAVPPESPQ